MSARVIPDREQLAARAVALRLDGIPYRAIGQRLGVSPMTALAWCREAASRPGTDAARLRAIEVGRLDRQLATLSERRADLVSASSGPHTSSPAIGGTPR